MENYNYDTDQLIGTTLLLTCNVTQFQCDPVTQFQRMIGLFRCTVEVLHTAELCSKSRFTFVLLWQPALFTWSSSSQSSDSSADNALSLASFTCCTFYHTSQSQLSSADCLQAGRYTIPLCNQPTPPTQPSIPPGYINQVPAFLAGV